MATARRFVEEGASVVISGRTQEKLEKVAETMPEDRVLVHVADVSVSANCDAVVAAAVERFGRLDTVVNGAGMNLVGAVTETSDETWRNAIGTDLDSTNMATTSFTSVRNEADRPGPIHLAPACSA